MTLTQFEAFVFVVWLGFVKFAAAVLGVSEPAVSSALAALRQHLGDPLVSRTASGMQLTPGGQRLVGIASQMVSLAADAEGVSEIGRRLPQLHVPVRRVGVCGSASAVWSAVAEGHGVAPTFAHLVAREVEEGGLVVLPVRGTPVDLFWYVSTLEASRC